MMRKFAPNTHGMMIPVSDKAKYAYYKSDEADKCIEELRDLASKLDSAVSQQQKLATQRGERMQIMKGYMESRCEMVIDDGDLNYETFWDSFIEKHSKALGWFDADGKPVREGSK